MGLTPLKALRLGKNALDTQTVNPAARQIPVYRLTGAESQKSTSDRRQYRNPTRHRIGLAGVDEFDLTRRAGTLVEVDQTRIHGDDILWNTIRRDDNGSIQLFGQIMRPDQFAQAYIIVQGYDQIHRTP